MGAVLRIPQCRAKIREGLWRRVGKHNFRFIKTWDAGSKTTQTYVFRCIHCNVRKDIPKVIFW